MLALMLALCPLPQTTWIVDGSRGPGTSFTDLPPAVAAAQSGDTILVRRGSGQYSTFQVSGKALVIASIDAVAAPTVLSVGESRIDNVPAGAMFSVVGLRFSLGGLTVAGSSTVATLIGCEIADADGFFPVHGLRVVEATVFAQQCRCTGGGIVSVFTSGPAGSGAFVDRGRLIATDCTFQGGDGANHRSGAFVAGGHGVLNAGDLWLFDCAATGGSLLSGGAGVGGAGVWSIGGIARLAGASVLQPGTGSPVYPALHVAPGRGTVHQGVTLVALPGGAAFQGNVTLAAAMPRLRVGGAALRTGALDTRQQVLATVGDAPAFAPMLVAMSPTPAVPPLVQPLLEGEVFVPPAAFGLGAVLDANGAHSHAWSAGSVPAFVGLPVFAQVAVLDVAANRIRMSNVDVHVYD